MEQIGKVFRQLRESRNISLRQATGGQFSPSMLSRFETGQSELSVEKFLFALENISASVEEILFLARGFQYDTDSELRKEILDVLDQGDIDANAFQHKPDLDQQLKDRGITIPP